MEAKKRKNGTELVDEPCMVWIYKYSYTRTNGKVTTGRKWKMCLQGDREPAEVGQKGLPKRRQILKWVEGFKWPVTAYWPPW